MVLLRNCQIVLVTANIAHYRLQKIFLLIRQNKITKQKSPENPSNKQD